MGENLWFTDDPTPLVNRRNWNRAKLDEYLKRDYCCKFVLLLIVMICKAMISKHTDVINAMRCGVDMAITF